MAAVATPFVLTDPGILRVAPLASTMPNMGETAVTASKFTDAWPAAWLPLGATTEGSTFKSSTTVEAIRVAELFDPVKQVTTERASSIAFALADFTLQRYQLSANGGIAALTAAIGTGVTAVYNYEPPDPGTEVRIMVGWESLDGTMRLVLRQTIQGGEVSIDFKRAPSIAAIPCVFNTEVPVGLKPYKWASTRG